PYNWKILYYETGYEFSPIYDNGASLGFHFNDEQLRNIVADVVKLNRYIKRTKVKVGLFEGKNVKAKDLIKYIQSNFPYEFNNSIRKLYEFDLDKYKQ